MSHLPSTNTVYCIPATISACHTNFVPRPRITFKMNGTTTDGGLGQLALRWLEERIWSMLIQCAPWPGHINQCGSRFPAKQCGIERTGGYWRTLLWWFFFFFGWDHCRRRAHKDKERYTFFVEPLTLVVDFTTPDPRYPYAKLSLRAAPNSNLHKVSCSSNQDPWNNQDSIVMQKLGSVQSIIDYTLISSTISTKLFGYSPKWFGIPCIGFEVWYRVYAWTSFANYTARRSQMALAGLTARLLHPFLYSS